MHKKLLVGTGVIALAATLAVAPAYATSQTRSSARPGQGMQLAKDDSKAAPADQPAPKKKHKHSKKHSGAKGTQAAPPAAEK